jgi:hypothetical protein
MAAQNDAVSKRFDVIRKRIGQDVEGGKQQETEALQRRFASAGMLGSGASMKTESQARANLDQQRQQAMEGVDMAEIGEQQRLAEQQAAMDFARSERLGSQDFAAAQADLMRKYQTSERLGSQKFAQSERLGAQGFSKEMQGLQNAFQQKLFNKQFKEQTRQFNIQFAEDKRVNDFNMLMGNKQFNKKGLMDMLQDPIGTSIRGIEQGWKSIFG